MTHVDAGAVQMKRVGILCLIGAIGFVLATDSFAQDGDETPEVPTVEEATSTETTSEETEAAPPPEDIDPEFNKRLGTMEEHVNTLKEQGIDISGHRSSLLTDYLLAESDLIVAMTRVHESAVAALDQDARARTFLAGEVPRLGGTVGPLQPGMALREWVALLHGARGGHMTAGRTADEVGDPYGMDRSIYEALHVRLGGMSSAMSRLLSPG